MPIVPSERIDTPSRPGPGRGAACSLLSLAAFTLLAVSTAAGAVASAAAPPQATSPPTIAGPVRAGSMLLASPGGWSGSPTAYAYQWLRCNATGEECTVLAKATDQTYVPTASGVGFALRVEVTATGPDGTGIARSEATAPVAAAHRDAPRLLSLPRIGEPKAPKLGETLVGGLGRWAGRRSTFAVQWLRCGDRGGPCVEIAGATNRRYTTTDADVGLRLRVRVTATNSLGSTVAYSLATDPVQRVLAKPRSTARPLVTGTAREGETLTASPGAWTGATPISFSYQWLRCDRSGDRCGAISGATGQSYVVTAADVGHVLRVRVTASNAAGSVRVVSRGTSIVAARPAPATAPVSRSAPTIAGTPREGSTLTANAGAWGGTAPISLSYQWRRCDTGGSSCADIPGATGRRYTLTSADVGRRLRVLVLARNSLGTASALSGPTAVVAPAATAPANVRAPSLSGAAREGETLTVNRGEWSGTGPLAFDIFWQRCDPQASSCGDIPGARGDRYTLTRADVGRRIRVRVTVRNSAGSSTAYSAQTAVVAPRSTPPPPPSPGPPAGLPPGAVRLAGGGYSIPVTSVSLPQRLVISGVSFTPNPLRSREPFLARFRVTDTRGFAVRGALVFVLGLPYGRIVVPPELQTGTDGWVTIQIQPTRLLPLERGAYLVMFVRARKPGDSLLAGVSTRRLVQLRLAPPAG